MRPQSEGSFARTVQSQRGYTRTAHRCLGGPLASGASETLSVPESALDVKVHDRKALMLLPTLEYLTDSPPVFHRTTFNDRNDFTPPLGLPLSAIMNVTFPPKADAV